MQNENVSQNFMTTVISRPTDIKREHLRQIIDLVVTGGQIKRDGLQERILRADKVAYTLHDSKVICTATLKNPNNSYRTRVFNSAKAKTTLQYEKELGYIVTHPDFEKQGHCKNLLKIFFPKISANSIFATTRKPAMVHILGNFGFQQTGNIYDNDLTLLTYNGKK